MADEVTADEVKQLFAAYLNNNLTTANNFIDFVFGAGDRTITGDLTVTGAVITNQVKQRTTTGLSIGLASDKLGFYGTTPEVQQVLATGTGKTVDQVITALQGIGLFKQS